jgi:hypothetical protein
MISQRLGKSLPDGEIRERIQGDRLAAERFQSMQEHLARNGVDLSQTHAALGPWLTMEPQAERFIDHDAANALLRRNYRPPFAVPETV